MVKNRDIKGTRQISQFSNSNWRLTDAHHVGVAIVEQWVKWVPGSGALSVGVVAEDAETFVVTHEVIAVDPIVVHVTVVRENGSARQIRVIAFHRASLGECFEAVVHLFRAASAHIITFLALVAVSVHAPVHAEAELIRRIVVVVRVPALGAVIEAFVEPHAWIVGDDQGCTVGAARAIEIVFVDREGLSGEGRGSQDGSNERLLHLKLNYNKFVAHALNINNFVTL